MKVLINKETFEDNRFVKMVQEIYHYITKTFPERLSRSIAYFKLGWHNYDFDYSCVHDLMLFKLKRLLHCFEKYGYHSEECSNYKPKMKSLKLTIKLLEKYCKNDYTKFYDLHERKWGPSTIKWIPTDIKGNDCDEEDPKFFRFTSSRPKALTDEDIELEKKEFREAYDADEREQEKHLRLAYQIMIKYHRYWWD